MKMKFAVHIVVFFLLSFGSSNCSAQNVNISNSEINEILLSVDTFSCTKNFHVLLSSYGKNSETFLISIWINDRLEGVMLKEAGLGLSRSYKLGNSNVYVYEILESKDPDFICTQRSVEPSYELSPFHVKDGFIKDLVAERFGSKLVFGEVEFIEDEEQIIWDDM